MPVADFSRRHCSNSDRAHSGPEKHEPKVEAPVHMMTSGASCSGTFCECDNPNGSPITRSRLYFYGALDTLLARMHRVHTFALLCRPDRSTILIF